MAMARLTKAEVVRLVEEWGGNLCVCVLGANFPIPGCTRKADDPHRIIFGSQGGKYEVENVAGLCRYCHDAAHGKIADFPMTQKEIREALLEIVGEREDV